MKKSTYAYFAFCFCLFFLLSCRKDRVEDCELKGDWYFITKYDNTPVTQNDYTESEALQAFAEVTEATEIETLISVAHDFSNDNYNVKSNCKTIIQEGILNNFDTIRVVQVDGDFMLYYSSFYDIFPIMQRK